MTALAVSAGGWLGCGYRQGRRLVWELCWSDYGDKDRKAEVNLAVRDSISPKRYLQETKAHLITNARTLNYHQYHTFDPSDSKNEA